MYMRSQGGDFSDDETASAGELVARVLPSRFDWRRILVLPVTYLSRETAVG